VTDDEVLVFQYRSETNCGVIQWESPVSPKPKSMNIKVEFTILVSFLCQRNYPLNYKFVISK
jgi:hypothetical protein